MIITKTNQITILSPGEFNIPGDNYTLLLQDKLSKKIYFYNFVSISQSKLYWRFENHITQPDNEYEYVLIHNPNKLDDSKIIVEGDDILTCNLTAGKDAPLKKLDKGYIRVGDYKASTIDYTNNKTFIVYEN